MIHRIASSVKKSLVSSLSEDLDIPLPNSDGFAGYLELARDAAFRSNTPDEFYRWYLRSEVLSKYVGDSNSHLLKERALETFYASEESCKLANWRLADFETCSLVSPENIRILKKARRVVRSILGRFKLDELPRRCKFGPGASTSLRSRNASHQKKWQSSSHITAGALPYYRAFYKWARLDGLPDKVKIVDGSKVTTVPKSWKTERTIAIEPDWNMFFQLGVGSMIRSRLQRKGILLTDAQSRNRELARWGSWTGYLATLDLKAASDSVSLSLCEALLPSDWFKVLVDLRSHSCTMPDGKVVILEKISSMGNGFTFELETLLFYSLALAVCRRDDWKYVSAYGDDLIVPCKYFETMTDILNCCGFGLNETKSFAQGPFRESCGGHYFEGFDVTPFYQKYEPKTLGENITLGNKLVTHSARFDDVIDVIKTYRLVASRVPRKYRGPWGVSGVLWSEWDQSHPVWSKAFQSYRQLAVSVKHKYQDVSSWTGAYFHKLWLNSVEVEASRIPRPLRREKSVSLYFCRDQWRTLPVRMLCRYR